MKLPNGVGPNSWHKTVLAKVSTENSMKFLGVKIWVMGECPYSLKSVSIYDCNDCKFGVAGSYKEGWVMCNYHSLEEKTVE